MARKQPRPEVSRRKFLAGAAVAGATTALAPPAAKAAATDASVSAPRRPSALPPTMQVAVAETATPKELPRIGGVPGSDFMVDVIKTLDIKYLPSNPASSFRAIHESLIISAVTRCRNSSLARTRNPRSPWRTATSRWPASR